MSESITRETSQTIRDISIKEKAAKRNVNWLLLSILVLLLVMIGIVLGISENRRNRNKLAVGELAQVEFVRVVIEPPVEFDFKAREEILQLRQEAAARYSVLLSGRYKPSYDIFHQIKDGKPWYGVEGQFYYGTGERSIEGVSEEARFILNPYLLVAAEFNGFWNSVLSEDQLEGFPLYCAPHSLLWWPEESFAEVSYNASCVVERINIPLDLIAYNARDFNLNYIYVSYEDSINISNQDQPDYAYQIPQYIHLGGSCQYPGGCNNMSPATPEINGLQVTGLPAQVEIWLWQEQPDTIEHMPDMRFIIHFD